jgi:hypothetical protein
MESKRVETFDDWKDIFRSWQKDIGYGAGQGKSPADY